MRTTLTIDDDVAVQLEEERKRRRASLKEVVNDALRRGLQEMGDSPKKPRKPFRTRTFDSVPLVPDVDNVAEVLAYAEGEDFK
jgi:hypothetical protein